MKATEKEIAILLERVGLDPVSVLGSRSKDAARGGIVARISVSGETPELSIVIGNVRAAAHLPVDDDRVTLMLETLEKQKVIPHHAAFTHMLSHLLIKTAQMYLASGASNLTLDSVHLRENGYHIGNVDLNHSRPLHLKARAESSGRDSTFTHTQRD